MDVTQTKSSMNVIQTKSGLKIKIFNNWIDCLYRSCCPEREKREEILIMHRCSFNPSILECKAYQDFDRQLDVQKIRDLIYL